MTINLKSVSLKALKQSGVGLRKWVSFQDD